MIVEQLIEELQVLINRGAVSPSAEIEAVYDGWFFELEEINKDPRLTSRNLLRLELRTR